MFPMGSEKYQPFPNVIYNIYAKCDEDVYAELRSEPFFAQTKHRNDQAANCTLTIISPESVFQTTGSIHLIGYGSRLYKKLSWTLKFDKKFLGRKAVKMRAMANDPSLLREKLATELYKAAGIPVQECTFARFFVNGDNYGLYTLLDRLNRKWIKNYIHGDSKANIGYAYKMDSAWPGGPFADFKYEGEDWKVYPQRFTYMLDELEPVESEPEQNQNQTKKKSSKSKSQKVQTAKDKEKRKVEIPKGKEAAAWAPFIEFTRRFREWVDQYDQDTSDQAVQALEQFFNVESLLRVLAMETLTLATDNFWLVMSNSDLYYNPERQTYQILPFDFDRLLSGPLDNPMINPVGYMEDCTNWVHYNETVMDHYFTNHILAHPQIQNRYNVILAKLARFPFHKTIMNRYVEALAGMIEEEVAWNFELTDQLTLPYNGRLRHYTLTDFQNNLVNRHLDLEAFVQPDQVQIDLMQFIEMRGDGCRAATAHIDLTQSENPVYDVTLKEEDVLKSFESSSSSSSSSSASRAQTLTGSIWLGLILIVLLNL